MQPPPHIESTARQQQQQQQQATTSQVSSASASLARHGQADAHTDTELSSPGTLFRVASEQQQQQPNHPLHTRAASHGHNRNPNSISSINNGNHPNVNNKRAPAAAANTTPTAATAMGDGIINQSMKEDLDNWLTALGLAPGQPINVVGYFGHCKDLSMFERIAPVVRRKDSTYEASSCIGSFEDDERMPVFYDGCRDSSESRSTQGQGATAGGAVQNGGWTLGLNDQKTTGDIHLFVDRAKNVLMLQHAYLYDTQEMLSACQESADAITKDRTSLMKWMHDQEYESHRALLFLFLVSHVVVHTSPDMNLDPRMVSILAALSTIKRQMLQELDRFMAICWDRIGVPPPDHDRNQSENGNGGGRGSNPLANILTPGRCVPALVFVIERVPIIAPWHEAGANETQIVEQLRQQLLKKSIDAMQTRLRYLFRACRLIQSVDSSAGAFDGRQLFVLPSPSSTPFVHVIPHFIGQLELPETLLDYSEDNESETLDPAAAVMRNRMKSTAGGSQSTKKQGLNAKSQSTKSQRDKTTARSITEEGNRAPSNPTLREIYDAIVQARDQPLSGTSVAGARSAADGSSQLSLGGLYLDYSGPQLRQFVDGWVRNVTGPGGYGSIIGRRHIGSVEVPSSQQWLAGYLGVCEALGVTSINSPGNRAKTTTSRRKNVPPLPQKQDDPSTDESLSSRVQNVSISGGGANGEAAGGGAAAVRERGSRRGGGKKYSLRCAHLVQKKIQDFVQTDEVMEELYGQKPELAATRAHSERYHQLKADQATKLFNSLAYRR